MIVSGQFPFLHQINVAWLLQARKAADAAGESLRVKLLPDPEHSQLSGGDADSRDTRAAFLNAFGFADAVEKWVPGDPVIGDVPVPSTPSDIQTLLNAWIESKSDCTIFMDSQKFNTMMAQKEPGRKITTNGCYDVLHPGHLATLEYAASLGDILIVLINSDTSVRRFKGADRPIHAEGFRAALLSCLKPVDYVVVFNDDNPLSLMEEIRPEGHVKGGSFIPERIRAEQETLSRWGGQFYAYPMKGSYSTSAILEHYSKPPFPL